MTLHPLSTQLQLRRRRPALFQWGLAASLLIAIAFISLAGFYAYGNSDIVVHAVEWARDVVGPQPVAIAEELAFKIEDWYDHLNYQLTGNDSSWHFVAPTSEPALRLNTPKVSQVQRGAINGLKVINAGPMLASTSTFTPLPSLAPIIPDRAFADEGQWHPLATAGQPADQPPMLWSTFIRPDPDRPYARVALVAMDLNRSRLHLMAGTKEPESTTANFAYRPGMIPPEVQASGTLLAAWNGGFRAIHGHYGMMSDGVTWLSAESGMATLAIKRDGRVVIGAWGRDVSPAMDLVAWRQNNPPLIENGVVNPDVHAITNLKE